MEFVVWLEFIFENRKVLASPRLFGFLLFSAIRSLWSILCFVIHTCRIYEGIINYLAERGSVTKSFEKRAQFIQSDNQN